MKIGDFCTRQVVTVGAAADLRMAAILMRNAHVGALVVTEHGEAGGRPTGIVTDRDLVVAGIALAGAQPDAIRVRDVMSTRLALVCEDQGVFEAARTMSERGVRRLPVVTADGRLCGIVTADDLQRVMATEMSSLAAALKLGTEQEELEHRLDVIRRRMLPPAAA